MNDQRDEADPDVLDLDGIAGIFRVTEKAVRGWILAGMPVVHKGKPGRQGDATRISLRAAVEWYFSENYERLELDRQRTRLSSEQADRQALDNAVTRGDLLDANRIGDGIERALVAFRERLRGMATKLAPRVNPEKPNLARDLIAAELDAVLHALADNFSRSARGKLAGDDGDESRGVAPSGKANGKRVGRSVSASKPRDKRRAGAVGH